MPSSPAPWQRIQRNVTSARLNSLSTSASCAKEPARWQKIRAAHRGSQVRAKSPLGQVTTLALPSLRRTSEEQVLKPGLMRREKYLPSFGVRCGVRAAFVWGPRSRLRRLFSAYWPFTGGRHREVHLWRVRRLPSAESWLRQSVSRETST